MEINKNVMIKTFNENAALRGAWRRIFARSPFVREVLNEGRRTVPRYKKDGTRHKVDEVQFQCQVCGDWVMRKFIEVDHIVPVIDEKLGFQNWDIYHDRLFCDKKNLERICYSCHDKKTSVERMKRNTIKYNLELNLIENHIKLGLPFNEKDTKKLLSKYKTKTRPLVIRERAIRLTESLLKICQTKKRRGDEKL